MAKNLRLSESGFSLGKVTGKNRWRARLIKAGAGSTGFYTEAAMRETGAAAFPAGTKINADHHNSWREVEEQPAGSVTTLIGAVATTPEFVEDGLYAEVEFSDQWAPFVEQFAPILGLSINAFGYGEQVTEMGLPIVEGFIPSELNTVDLVTVPGAGGRLIELAESYRESSARIENEVPDHTDRKKMTPEDIQALVEAIKVAVKEAVTPAAPADPVDDAPAAIDVAAVSEALVEAELPKAARGAVYKALESGASLEEAIQEQKDLITALQESLAPEGHVVEVDGKHSFRVGRWTK